MLYNYFIIIIIIIVIDIIIVVIYYLMLLFMVLLSLSDVRSMVQALRLPFEYYYYYYYYHYYYYILLCTTCSLNLCYTVEFSILDTLGTGNVPNREVPHFRGQN